MPVITTIRPQAALPKGEVEVLGMGLAPGLTAEIGGTEAIVSLARTTRAILQVPAEAKPGSVIVSSGPEQSEPHEIHIGVLLTEDVHPVASPAADPAGNLYTTLSGSRGQQTPVSIFRLTRSGDDFRGPPLRVRHPEPQRPRLWSRRPALRQLARRRHGLHGRPHRPRNHLRRRPRDRHRHRFRRGGRPLRRRSLRHHLQDPHQRRRRARDVRLRDARAVHRGLPSGLRFARSPLRHRPDDRVKPGHPRHRPGRHHPHLLPRARPRAGPRLRRAGQPVRRSIACGPARHRAHHPRGRGYVGDQRTGHGRAVLSARRRGGHHHTRRRLPGFAFSVTSAPPQAHPILHDC